MAESPIADIPAEVASEGFAVAIKRIASLQADNQALAKSLEEAAIKAGQIRTTLEPWLRAEQARLDAITTYHRRREEVLKSRLASNWSVDTSLHANYDQISETQQAAIRAAKEMHPVLSALLSSREALMDKKEESDGELLQRLGTDASKWAAEFRATALRLGYSDMDEGWLLGWFANAIEHARSAAREALAGAIKSSVVDSASSQWNGALETAAAICQATPIPKE